jgi:mannitol-1-phosphate/altronate dehydrogenase
VVGSATARVAVPTYDRTALEPAVVHLGVGGFHRAHQLSYFDQLANLQVGGWGVVGVGIRNPRLGQVLCNQDNLFTVVERGSAGSTARVVGVMVDYLLLADAPAAVLARLVDPRTRLVTMTITGDGYQSGVYPSDVDATPARTSVFPVIAAALEQRRNSGTAPFTVLSCDNLPNNGSAARAAVLAAAYARDPALAGWIRQSVAFPDSMVDRITPAAHPDDHRLIQDEFNVTDGWPVVTEPFSQWVIEDRFCNTRPPLDRVGVRFVEDVTPYKLIKSRLLNGAHCALGYLGSLAGHRRTDEAMMDPVISAYVSSLMARELAPLLPAGVPGMELTEYQRTLLDRLRNPAVGDFLSRLCRRGSTKMPAYLLPSLRAAQSSGRPRQLLLLAVAGWLRYLRGTSFDGVPIEIEDARADELRRLARARDPRALLGLTDIFGELAQHEEDVRTIATMLADLDNRGVSATVRRTLCQS